tara:strand:- start:5908 stop:6102 length:195 start_codon:yes stop_codon:yes gene_type:complete
MAGVKARGIISVNNKRMRENANGELTEVRPVKYYGAGSNGRMCGSIDGEMIVDENGRPIPLSQC